MEVFILKLLPVDALAPGAIMVGEIASLDHELLDNCQKQIYSKLLFAGQQDRISAVT